MSTNNFQKLYEMDVNHKTKGKNGLKYLSWAFAWAEFKRVNPDANYTVDQYDGKPYLNDPALGLMVSTKVTVCGETIPMSLPVLDGANNAMKTERYSYKVKEWVNRKFTGEYIDKFVEPATMFDINTAMMRCLTKNLAMFGLGLYIYAGEDIPSLDPDEPTENDRAWIDAVKANPEAINQIDDAVYKMRIELFIKEGK
tara:strand:- start:485 stop:1078 length:594 start_codon:yes stop_codon:yes gene_type:complete